MAPTEALLVATEVDGRAWVIDLLAGPVVTTPGDPEGLIPAPSRHHRSWRVSDLTRDSVFGRADAALTEWGYQPPATVSHRYVWVRSSPGVYRCPIHIPTQEAGHDDPQAD